jgi:hypothetical protein
MVQRGSGFRLTPKLFQSLAVLGYVFWKKLESNKPVEARVLCFVHHAHPAATEPLDDAIVRGGLVNQVWEFRHCAEMLGASQNQVNQAKALMMFREDEVLCKWSANKKLTIRSVDFWIARDTSAVGNGKQRKATSADREPHDYCGRPVL